MEIWALTRAHWFTIGWTILTLILLEGLLSADNALVLAMMVRHLPRKLQKRALRYGIWGAFIFRFLAVAFASVLVDFWFFQVLGGLYLVILALKHFLWEGAMGEGGTVPRESRQARGFWRTVVAVELADIAFSIDSILAAVGLANKLDPEIRDGRLLFVSHQLWIVYVGGILGIVAMRYVAGLFLRVLERFPGLADGAYLLVGWIGLNLVGEGCHKGLHPPGDRAPAVWVEALPAWVHAVPLQVPPLVFWLGMVLIPVVSLVWRRNVETK